MLRFGSFVLTADRLVRDGRTVPLAAKPFGVLREMLGRPGETVGREQFATHVWGTGDVSDQSIARSIFQLRQALEESEPGAGRHVETVYGRGYRFAGDVEAQVHGPAPPLARLARARKRDGGGENRAHRAAHDLCLLGRATLARGTPRLNDAFTLFERALVADPSYAPALAGLAECHLAGAASGLTEAREAVDRARALLLDAARLDPGDGLALACRGHLSSVYDRNVPAADAAFAGALELARAQAAVHWLYGLHLLSLGRFDEALAEIDVSAELDPANLSLLVHRTFALYCAGRAPEALARCRDLMHMEPLHPAPRLTLALMAPHLKRPAEALEALQPLEAAPEALGSLLPIATYARACAGDVAGATGGLARMDRQYALGRTGLPTLAAQAAARLGQSALAAQWLERAVARACPWVAYAAVLPGLAPLHGQPAFATLLRKIGRGRRDVPAEAPAP